MNKETLDKILDENRRDTIGLGVNNVNSRLKHVFGDEYGLSIESEVNKGTCVSIKIPTVKLSEGGM